MITLAEKAMRRLKLLFARGVVRWSVDTTGLRTLQVEALAGEIQSDVEQWQQYGFTSRPKAGAEAVVVFPRGSRSAAMVLAVEDRRYRIKELEEGEVVIYTDEGDRIGLRRNGEIEVVAGSRVHVTAPLTRIEGDLEVTGEVKDRCDLDGSTMEHIRTIFDLHTHVENGVGNFTNPPIPQMG